MDVVFLRPGEEPELVVGRASWDGRHVTITSEDEAVRTALAKAFRRIAVVTDDAAYRNLGAHGEVVIQPGNLEWFRAAATVRAPAETGLTARLIPGIAEGGFDPAAGYREFEEQLERLDERTRG
ncbi:MAG TPA: hypothetical protein VF235_04950 [Actinomycetota bacterium]